MQQAVELKAPAVAASALERYAELGLAPTGVQVPVCATLLFPSLIAGERGSSFKVFSGQSPSTCSVSACRRHHQRPLELPRKAVMSF